jgi:hypothetical protein
VLLFHHDPAHDDARLQSLEGQATEDAERLGIAGRVELAREGMTLDL